MQAFNPVALNTRVRSHESSSGVVHGSSAVSNSSASYVDVGDNSPDYGVIFKMFVHYPTHSLRKSLE